MTLLMAFYPEIDIPLDAVDGSIVVAGNTSNNPVPTSITLSGSVVTPDSLAVDTQPSHGSADIAAGALVYTPSAGYVGSDSFTYTGTLSGTVSSAGTITVDVQTNYNCDCTDTTGNKTLKQLRDDLMRRLGFGGQVNNPPPGMTDLLNSFLIEAQELLYRRYDVLRTERFYQWSLQAGVRFYDLDANLYACTKKLDPRKLTWVGVIRNGVWTPIIEGIPPELYTMNSQAWPLRYEIRQCIEVWPVPAATEGQLVIKGHFGLEPFAVDTDVVTIDDRAVFLLALANAKSHYGRPDAGNYVQELETYLLGLAAGTHGTRRYVPGSANRADWIYTMPKPTVPFS